MIATSFERDDPKRFDAGRNAAIDGDLRERVLQFVPCHAIAQRGAYMERELLRPVERGEHSQIHEALVPAAERGPPSARTPAIFRNKFLERSIEAVCTVEPALHGFLAKHFGADPPAFDEPFTHCLVHNRISLGHSHLVERIPDR